jgi:hypothetical protein
MTRKLRNMDKIKSTTSLLPRESLLPRDRTFDRNDRYELSPVPKYSTMSTNPTFQIK